MDAEALAYGENQPKLAKFQLNWKLAEETAIEPPAGRVAWADKVTPVEERVGATSGAPYIFSRGFCDVNELATRLLATDEIWSSEYAKLCNVELVRPSHDAWGIRKLCFVFCDDFLQRAYRLPLWADPEWRRLLDRIFLTSGVRPEQVVRCLLASMPPRTVIPAHHDSGYWVSRTHRLHCAIVTNDRVVFRVGPNAESMVRFELKPGRIVELNNQAKHYVANLGAHYRTHLIFDYVDERFDPVPTVELNIGERLLQTRRSIALASECGSGPPAPHFIIIGAQKAGTTSMYEYLAKHPLVVKGKRRETHFLDWRWVDKASDPAALWHTTYFDVHQHADHPSLIAGDSTPSYLLNSLLAIPRLKAMRKDHLPFIVMLRDPVARAASHFAMITDPEATPAQRRTRGTAWLGKSLAVVALEELRYLVHLGLLVRKGPLAHKDAPAAPRLTDPFVLDSTRLNVVLSEMPNHGAHSLLLRGLYALQLRPWLAAFPSSSFFYVRCEDLDVDAHLTNDLVLQVQRHVGLREHPLDLKDAKVKHNKRERDPLPSKIEAELRAFYEPFNDDLYQLLGWPSRKQWH